jgi:hypothetical protein
MARRAGILFSREAGGNEADGDRGDYVDDEPSLGSLDGRMSQKRWGLPDASDCWWMATDIEYGRADRRRIKAWILTSASGIRGRTALQT